MLQEILLDAKRVHELLCNLRSRERTVLDQSWLVHAFKDEAVELRSILRPSELEYQSVGQLVVGLQDPKPVRLCCFLTAASCSSVRVEVSRILDHVVEHQDRSAHIA